MRPGVQPSGRIPNRFLSLRKARGKFKKVGSGGVGVKCREG